MPTVHVETVIDRAPDEVWEVISDWEKGPARMAPGFVTDSRLDGGDRLVTFANGMTVKEIKTGQDDARRRLAWSVVSPTVTHHNGAFTVHDAGDGKSRVTWIADVLPDAAAQTFEQMMTAGIAVMAKALGR
jgi:hypothetical protein